jgi:hypothetical protein
MKKEKIKKLNLGKETVVKLSNWQQTKIMGGLTVSIDCGEPPGPGRETDPKGGRG